MGYLWVIALGWVLSFVTLLIPGYLLTKLIFSKSSLGVIDSFLSSLVLGTALTVLPPAILGPYLKGFPSFYARFILLCIWVIILSFFLIGLANKRIKIGWDWEGEGFKSRVFRALKIDSLAKLMFIAVPLFTFLYFALNIFVINAVGWTACSYYIPVAEMIYGSDIIPAYDLSYNLGEPIAKPPLPSLLYSTLFFQLSNTDHHALAVFPILFGLGCTLCVYALARLSLDGRTAALSAIIFATTPLFMACFTFSYLYSADLFTIFFFSTAIYTYHRALEVRSNGMAVVSGLSSCLAILSRSYCLYVLPLTLLLIHSLSWKKRQQAILTGFIVLSVAVTGLLLRGGNLLLLTLGVLVMVLSFLITRKVSVDGGDYGRRHRPLLIILALSSLGVFWYLRNLMLFGDPVYPHLGALMKTGPFSDDFIGNLFHEVSNFYWKPVGESAHVGNLLNTVLVPLLSFDFGIFLFLFKISGFLTFLRNRNPLNRLFSPWVAVSYVSWLLLFNYSTNYLIQILPLLSVVCAVGMMAVYDKLEGFVGYLLGEERKPKIIVSITVFTLFGFYLCYFLDLKGLLPEILSPLWTSALYFNLPFLENFLLSLLPFLVLPFSLFYSIIKWNWGRSFHLRVDGRKKALAMTVLLGGLLLTFNFYIAPQGIIGIFGEAAFGGFFSQEEAHELTEFMKNEVPKEVVIFSLLPEPMRMLTEHKVIYFFTPGGMFEFKDLLFMEDEARIIEKLKGRGITCFIVPETTNKTENPDLLSYKFMKREMIYNTYLFLAQNFRVFNLPQQEDSPFERVFSNGSYAIYLLL